MALAVHTLAIPPNPTVVWCLLMRRAAGSGEDGSLHSLFISLGSSTSLSASSPWVLPAAPLGL